MAIVRVATVASYYNGLITDCLVSSVEGGLRCGRVSGRSAVISGPVSLPKIGLPMRPPPKLAV